MATSRLVGIQDAAGMIKYCLSARGKAKEPVGERVLQVHSSLLADGDDLQGMLSELKLHAGTKYEAYHLRVSFSPDERINPDQFPAFCEALSSKVLGGRAGIAVMHGDSNCQHIHFVSTFKDSAGKIINNKGAGKWTAAARLQHSVDAVCSDFGLSILSIPAGDIYRSNENSPQKGKVRRSLNEIRMKEDNRESFVAAIRHTIAAAVKSCRDFPEFESHLSRAAITCYSRGQSLVFQDAQGRKVRLNKMYSGMKSKSDLEQFISKKGAIPAFSGIAIINQKEVVQMDAKEKEKEKLEKLQAAEKAYAESYARRVAALSERGHSAEEIMDKLGYPDSGAGFDPAGFDPESDYSGDPFSLSDRWEILKENRARLEKALPLSELKEMERESKEAKFEARRAEDQAKREAQGAGRNFLSEINPEAVLAFGQGDPRALIRAIMALSPAVPLLVSATKKAAKKAAAGVKMSFEEAKAFASKLFAPREAQAPEPDKEIEAPDRGPSPGR